MTCGVSSASSELTSAVCRKRDCLMMLRLTMGDTLVSTEIELILVILVGSGWGLYYMGCYWDGIF